MHRALRLHAEVTRAELLELQFAGLHGPIYRVVQDAGMLVRSHEFGVWYHIYLLNNFGGKSSYKKCETSSRERDFYSLLSDF
jgi:hypothetical protein